MQKILTIIGARPQFIKAAAVSREIAKHKELIEVIVHTGQHFDANMSDVFFEQMSIPKPDYNLAINSVGHGAMTGRMMEKIEALILDEKPDWVMVYGDTNSTLAGALAATKLHVKVAHVEAGLRSFNMQMPEEVNRILTDRISTVLFCPTMTAIHNLQKEGYDNIDCKIVRSGDVMQDAAMFYTDLSEKPEFDLPENFVLATIHRAENTDDVDRLENIFKSFAQISKEIPVVLPLHPRTKGKIASANLDVDMSDIHFIDPVGYLQMVYLLQNCALVMTDSGGLQKEAFFFEKYCITLRDQTEWVELVEHGYNQIVGADPVKILKAFEESKTLTLDYDKDLYGKGQASAQIVKQFLK
jgi:UDP-GlcNAc3NAcA epimerase